MGYFAPIIRTLFARATAYAGTFSTTVVTLVVGWLAQRGITDVDTAWLQIVVAGFISVALLNLQKVALALDARFGNLAVLRWAVAITRLGAPTPDYDPSATYRKTE